ncbi:MAG: hypothetical protein Kow0060_20780 [Methylohalobius crimeensis]
MHSATGKPRQVKYEPENAVVAAVRIRSILLLLLSLIGGYPDDSAFAAKAPILLGAENSQPIGRSADWLQEGDGRLTIDEAAAAYRQGAFSPGRLPVLTFGIGADPVWIRFAVENPGTETLRRRISVESGWIDYLDVYIRRNDETVAAFHLGDRMPFEQRPVDSRNFAIDHTFAPGVSEVFLRVEPPDAMVVPIHLERPMQWTRRHQWLHYGYGFLYGFLCALMAYNAMLFVGLRETRYLLYSIYLGMFLLLNLSYTSHAFAWFWPNSPIWAQWSHSTLIWTYASSGLAFALEFLEIRRQFPRLYRTVIGYIAGGGILLIATILLDRQRDSLLLTFTYVFLFSVIMVVLGTLSNRAGVKPARYFLAAAFCAMAGAASTTLSVWGVIPYNAWTFRAVDIGMLLDATLLALALTYQFRLAQEKRAHAEELARLDPLTGVNNRRAFYDLSSPIWNISLRHGHDLSVVLLDLDHFKRLNDNHGHAAGDAVLKAVAKVLEAGVREQDVIARWGGEEFILLLPETNLNSAAGLAERLREAIARSRVTVNGRTLGVTASVGVASKCECHTNIETLITDADHCLYQAKANGRNCIAVVTSEDSMETDGTVAIDSVT